MNINKVSAATLLACSMLVTGMVSPDAALAKKKSKKCKASGNDIVSIAKKDGSFKNLTGALCDTGLSKTLSSKGPFTVFAPDDAAFAKLPKDERESLAKNPNVLKYHVVKGIVPAADLKNKRSVTTIQGESLMVDTKNDGELIVVDGAMVTKPDIKCSNGVIHVVDWVLVPERGK